MATIIDDELIELVEMELRELLDKYEFPGDDTPILCHGGGSSAAIETENRSQRFPTVDDLGPLPESAVDAFVTLQKEWVSFTEAVAGACISASDLEKVTGSASFFLNHGNNKKRYGIRVIRFPK